MSDAEYLRWLRDRLIYVYSESPNCDYVKRLERIIEHLKPTPYTRGVGETFQGEL